MLLRKIKQSEYIKNKCIFFTFKCVYFCLKISLLIFVLQEKSTYKNYVKFYKLQNNVKNFEICGLLKKLLTKNSHLGLGFLESKMICVHTVDFCIGHTAANVKRARDC